MTSVPSHRKGGGDGSSERKVRRESRSEMRHRVHRKSRSTNEGTTTRSSRSKSKKFRHHHNEGDDHRRSELRNSEMKRKRKKSKRSRPSSYKVNYDFNEPDTRQNIIMKDGEIIGATLVKLVQKLTAIKDARIQHLSDFLLTYRAFSSPQELFSVIRARFECGVRPRDMVDKNKRHSDSLDVDVEVISRSLGSSPTLLTTPPTEGGSVHQKRSRGASISEVSSTNSTEDRNRQVIRLRVFNLMKHWVENHPQDWMQDPALNELYKDFIQNVMPKYQMEKSAAILSQLMTRKKQELDPNGRRDMRSFSVAPPPMPIYPTVPENEELCLFQHVLPEEAARQLVILEYALFTKIKTREFLNQGWSKQDDASASPNVKVMIKRFNQTSTWVTTEVLKGDTVADRAKRICWYIELCQHLRKIGNYNAVMEVVSGLSASPVHRLKATWREVPSKWKSTFDSLKTLVDREKNSAALRAAISNHNPPRIPHLGMYLTDLTFAEDGNEDVVAGGLIHFEKYTSLAKIIKIIMISQQTPFNLIAVDSIQEVLIEPEGWGEDKLWDRSQEVEPSGGVAVKLSNKARNQLKREIRTSTVGIKDKYLQSKRSQNIKVMVSPNKGNPNRKRAPSGVFAPIPLNLNGRRTSSPAAREELKKGTLKQLMDFLVSEDASDEFGDAFLMTYRTFTTGRLFLDSLIQKYRANKGIVDSEGNPCTQCKSIRQLCHRWARDYFKDLVSDEGVYNVFCEFINTELSIVFPTAAVKIKEEVQAKLWEQSNASKMEKEIQREKPLLPSNMGTRDLTVMDCDPLEIARQITLFHQQMYKEMDISDILDRPIATLDPVVKYQTRLQDWIIANILSSVDPNDCFEKSDKKDKSRGLLPTIKFFIQVLIHLLQLRDYHAISCLYAALSLYDEVWEITALCAGNALDGIPLALGSLTDYDIMDKKTMAATCPVIPYIGMLHNVIEDIIGEADEVDGNLINFRKRQKLSRVVKHIFRASEPEYPLENVAFIRDLIMKSPLIDSNEIVARLQAAKPHFITLKKKLMKKQHRSKKKPSFSGRHSHKVLISKRASFSHGDITPLMLHDTPFDTSLPRIPLEQISAWVAPSQRTSKKNSKGNVVSFGETINVASERERNRKRASVELFHRRPIPSSSREHSSGSFTLRDSRSTHAS